MAVQEAVWQGVVELGHGAVQAVQRDGWQQQQGGSGGGGGEEQEMQRFRLHAGRKAIEGELSFDGLPSRVREAPEVLHHSGRINADERNSLKRYACKKQIWGHTQGAEVKEENCSGIN